MSETQNTEPFKLIQTGHALMPTVFYIECECGQRVATIGGFSLQVDVQPKMDLIGRCACGREHSFQKQAEAARAAQAAQQHQMPQPPQATQTPPEPAKAPEAVASGKPRRRGPGRPKKDAK